MKSYAKPSTFPRAISIGKRRGEERDTPSLARSNAHDKETVGQKKQKLEQNKKTNQVETRKRDVLVYMCVAETS
jgi:hypothetical protein